MLQKLNNLYNNILLEWGNDTEQERKKRSQIFAKQIPIIVQKINNFFKKQGLKCTVRAIPGIYFSDGWFQDLKFETNNSPSKGKEWWEWFWLLDHSKIAETEHLFFYNDSGHGTNVYLKDGWRPTSHRGEIGKNIPTFEQYWKNK